MKTLIRFLSFLCIFSVFDSGGFGENIEKIRAQRSIEFLKIFKNNRRSEIPAQSQISSQFSGQVQSSQFQNTPPIRIATNDRVPVHNQVYSKYTETLQNAHVTNQNVKDNFSERKNVTNFGLMMKMVRQFMRSMAQFLGIQNTVRVSDARKINKQVTRIKAENELPLDPEEQRILNEYSNRFNITFATNKQKREAVDNIKEALTSINNNNELYRRGQVTSTKELYDFSHLSEDDFANKYLGLLPLFDGYDRRRAALDPSTCRNVPESKNWNSLGKVPRVKNQRECGSCYIFSATAAIESAIAIEYGIEPPMLSRQHLVNCIEDPDTGGPNGCKAGRPEWVWRFARDEGGLVAEKDAPYAGIQMTCNRNLPKAPYTEVDYWEKIPFRGSAEEVEEQMKCRLATTGPFHIGMTVRKNDMGSFKSGIYKNADGICQTGENVNHGLLLVGYGEKLLEGDRKPTKYWIIQNSWGERWGEDGYLNVERGKNVCNFASDAYFPVLKKTSKKIDKPAVCKETQDISGPGQQYLKSLCLIESEKSYDEAQNFCLQNGMRLFKTDSNEARQALINYANSNWNGRDEFTPFIDGMVSNACKSIVNEGQGFAFDEETDCADRLPSVCEYNKN